MLRKAAMAVGAVFLVIGIAGFIPGLTTDSQLLGIFRIDGTHNLVHILSGLLFLAASQKDRWSRLAFQAMGVVYALVTVIGFLVGTDNSVLGLFHVDLADNILHLLLAVTFLYLGFAYPDRRVADATA
jgi:hypothetical protein